MLLKSVYLVWRRKRQRGMITLKSTHAEMTHVYFHTWKYIRTIWFVLATVIVLYGLSLQVAYATPVFRSDKGCPGQKPCAPNKAIDVGLQDSPMGNTKLRHILATTNTSHPSRSSMQNASNRVVIITSQSTTVDLRQKSMNVLRGLRANAPVNISMDMRYNPISLKNSYGCR